MYTQKYLSISLSFSLHVGSFDIEARASSLFRIFSFSLPSKSFFFLFLN